MLDDVMIVYIQPNLEILYITQLLYKQLGLSIFDLKFAMFNPLQPNVAFLYPLKTSENL